MTVTKTDLIFQVLNKMDDLSRAQRLPLHNEKERAEFFIRLRLFSKKELVDLIGALSKNIDSEIKLARLMNFANSLSGPY